MPPEITPKFPNTRHFGYPKIWVRVSSNPFYPISILQIVEKRVNQGRMKQIRALHVIIREQSAQD
jgi:hypothetical protein